VLSVIEQLRQTAPERNVTITIPNQLPAFADARLMRIALSNLIGNAWKYTGRNPDARISIDYIEEEKRRVFFIRDNGVGFDMNLAQKLFQPFQRLHSDEMFPGTGIGLAIVRKIIQCHKGKIWAESEPGKGSLFYFTLGREDDIS
jgi:light-regulated signal transduction histidine kinase (bacteriophytochrome)